MLDDSRLHDMMKSETYRDSTFYGSEKTVLQPCRRSLLVDDAPYYRVHLRLEVPVQKTGHVHEAMSQR